MSRKILLKALERSAGVGPKDAAEILSSLEEAMFQVLASGERVMFRGVMVLRARTSKRQVFHNPAHGGTVRCTAYRIDARIGTRLREELEKRGGASEEDFVIDPPLSAQMERMS